MKAPGTSGLFHSTKITDSGNNSCKMGTPPSHTHVESGYRSRVGLELLIN